MAMSRKRHDTNTLTKPFTLKKAIITSKAAILRAISLPKSISCHEIDNIYLTQPTT